MCTYVISHLSAQKWGIYAYINYVFHVFARCHRVSVCHSSLVYCKRQILFRYQTIDDIEFVKMAHAHSSARPHHPVTQLKSWEFESWRKESLNERFYSLKAKIPDLYYTLICEEITVERPIHEFSWILLASVHFGRCMYNWLLSILHHVDGESIDLA